MRVLGIDPGIGITGWAVVDVLGRENRLVAAGTIRTEIRGNPGARLKLLYEELLQLLASYTPQELAIEKLFFSKNVTTAMSVSEARGVILLACASCGLPVGEYTPPQIKRAITGAGNAKKTQVNTMLVHHVVGATIPKQDDAADAIAIAVTHSMGRRLA
jgi:crossover junction endodeoxyribonuclease RuvC